jgi:lipoic acid synthetase
MGCLDGSSLTRVGPIHVIPPSVDLKKMRDLRAHEVDVVTIGQYLQPSPKNARIDRWVHPDEFRWFREQGEALGFGSVFSGPLVRSSYRAEEQRHAAETGRGAVAS